ncbi:CPBP family intramembrane metalloprotease [Candidatus Uhrbacteria bacterium]|nr:CPBP family intramembrane metalloprotease [Candidatus Uhrbacteria bacterium]
MRRGTTIGFILALFVLPFALVWGGVVPVELRRWLYVVAGIATFAIARRQHWSLRELGFRWDNARAAALPYAILAIVGATTIVAIALGTGRVVRAQWWLTPHFAYGLLIPVSAAQELFYRALLIPLLARVHPNHTFIVLINATLFAFLHVIFPDPAIVLPLSFVGGIAFTALWLRWPNLWLASAVHIILNASFTLFCFGGFETSCIA